MSLIRRSNLTPKEVAARRQNARRSPGPRTARGKARSSLNALQHGERSASLRRFMRELGFRPYAFFRLCRLTPWPEGAVDPLRAIVVNMWLARRRPEARDLALSLRWRGGSEKGGPGSVENQGASNPQ